MKATKTLKSLSLLLAGLFTAGYADAQCTTYDFSSSAGWTQVNTGVAISSTQVTFSGAASGYLPRFVYNNSIPVLSDNSWTCEFDFRIDAGSVGPCATLIGFTEAGSPMINIGGRRLIPNGNPPNIEFANITTIAVYLTRSPIASTNSADWYITAGGKLRTGAYGYSTTSSVTSTASGNINLPAGAQGVTFYARLQRLSPTQGKLSLFSDAARTVSIGSSCFAINAAITGLSSMQIGNLPLNGVTTNLTYGKVDNISICNLNPTLTGPPVLCYNTSGIYKLSNGNSTVTLNCGFTGSTGFSWSAPAGSFLSNGVPGACFTSATGNGSQNGVSPGGSGAITCNVDYGCATVTYSRNVTVEVAPTAAFTTTTPYCSNEAILVNGSSATNETSHQWSLAPCTSAGVLTGSWNSLGNTPGTAGNANLTSLLPAFFPCPAYYKIRLVANNNCGSAISEQVIMVSCLPNVIAGTNTSLCPGGCTGLTSSGATAYSWSPAAGLSSTSVSNPTACPASTTVYTVTGSAPGCPSDAASVTVTVSTLSVNAGADHAMCCNGLYTMAPTVSGGTAPYTYNWSPATGLTCSHGGTHTATSCPAPWVRHCTSVNYVLTVTDAAGCSVTDQITVSTFPCRMEGEAEETALSGESISVYPNPASDEIQVAVSNQVAELIEITDLTGRVVLKTKPQNSLTLLNIAELPQGAYLIKIYTRSHTETREIIIHR
ncbi:MAG: T9SS type A sorting domain-containing protein [Bacteroidetes bacterium]|nr:T9SS type A sorting domain-containing protein [Bacteroidota bacterium]